MANQNGLEIKIFGDATEFNKTVKSTVSDAKDKFKKLGNEMQTELKRVETVGTTAFKTISGAVAGFGTAATAAISKTVKDSIGSFSNYEQLTGGVRTLFGTNERTIEEYARDVGKSIDEVKDEYNDLDMAQTYILNRSTAAFANAGVSANQYMDNVTGFAAALRSSTNSSYEAALVADRAMNDMADNANKMGTNIESIQHAYQGFAKSNFSMLDNLKLGYGGTKGEMERLIKDAAELTDIQNKLGITVDANSMSFGNMVNAISVIQESMGITGTTLKEAETTISGSFNMMNAAFENLKTGIVQGGVPLTDAINDVVYATEKFAGNLVPAIENSLAGIGQVVEGVAPIIIEKIPEMATTIGPVLFDSTMAIMQSVVNAINQSLDKINPETFGAALTKIETTGASVINSLTEGIKNNTDKIGTMCGQVMDFIVTGMHDVLPNILEIVKDLVGTFASGVIEYKAMIFEIGIQFITAIAEGLAESSDSLGEELMTVLSNLLQVVIDNLPTFLESIITIITNLANSIMENLPELLGQIGTVIYEAVDTLCNHLPEILTALVKIVLAIGAMIIEAVLAALIAIFQNLGEWWNGSLKPWFDELGDNIAQFLVEFFQSVDEWFSGLFDGIGDWFKKIGDDIGNWFKETIQNIVGWFNDIGDKVSDLKEKVSEKVGQIKEDIKNKVNDVKSDVSEKVNNIKSDVFEKVSNIKSDISEKVSDIKSDVSEKVSNIKSDVVEKVNDIKSDVFEKVSNLKSDLKEKVDEIFDNVRDFLVNLKDSIAEKVPEMCNDFVDFWKELPGRMLDIGRNIIEGLWNGISNAKDWLCGKISELCGSVTDWFKGFFGIASPSKVFAELGGYLSEGLAVGLDSETDTLKSVARDQVDQLTGVYEGLQLGAPQLSMAGRFNALSGFRQSVQTVTNENGNVFNFTNYIESGNSEEIANELYDKFRLKVRQFGGV